MHGQRRARSRRSGRGRTAGPSAARRAPAGTRSAPRRTRAGSNTFHHARCRRRRGLRRRASASRSTSVRRAPPPRTPRRARGEQPRRDRHRRGEAQRARRRSADRRAGRGPTNGGWGTPSGVSRHPAPTTERRSRRAPTAPARDPPCPQRPQDSCMLRRIVLARAIAPLLAVAALAGCGSSATLPPAAVPAARRRSPSGPPGASCRSPGEPSRPAAGQRPRSTAAAPSPSSHPRERVLEVHDAATRERDRPRARRRRPDARRRRPRRASTSRHHRRRAAGLRAAPAAAPDPPAPGPRQPVRHRRPTRSTSACGSRPTATNRLVELADGARPHRLRSFPSVRQPDSSPSTRHRVYVTGRADGVLQILDARDTGRQGREQRGGDEQPARRVALEVERPLTAW